MPSHQQTRYRFHGRFVPESKARSLLNLRNVDKYLSAERTGRKIDIFAALYKNKDEREQHRNAKRQDREKQQEERESRRAIQEAEGYEEDFGAPDVPIWEREGIVIGDLVETDLGLIDPTTGELVEEYELEEFEFDTDEIQDFPDLDDFEEQWLAGSPGRRR